ncbi:MAG: hypothetical protein WBC26_02340 [Alphaproteobacteria bacterium]
MNPAACLPACHASRLAIASGPPVKNQQSKHRRNKGRHPAPRTGDRSLPARQRQQARQTRIARRIADKGRRRQNSTRAKELRKNRGPSPASYPVKDQEKRSAFAERHKAKAVEQCAPSQGQQRKLASSAGFRGVINEALTRFRFNGK